MIYCRLVDKLTQGRDLFEIYDPDDGYVYVEMRVRIDPERNPMLAGLVAQLVGFMTGK